jgi:hypothetical protein
VSSKEEVVEVTKDGENKVPQTVQEGLKNKTTNIM